MEFRWVEFRVGLGYSGYVIREMVEELVNFGFS